MMENQPVNSIANGFNARTYPFRHTVQIPATMLSIPSRPVQHIAALRRLLLPNLNSSEKPSLQGMAIRPRQVQCSIELVSSKCSVALRGVASQVLFCHSNVTGLLMILAG